MHEFADWNELLTAIDCLDETQEAFIDRYSELTDAQYDSAVAHATANGDMPLQKFVEGLGNNSLYTKYEALRAAELEPAGIDTFAFTLFNSRPVQAILNTNFQVKVGGNVYDALNAAFGCASRSCVDSALLNLDYTFCSKFRTHRFQREITTDQRRRANVWSSVYPLGPIVLLTVNFDNEVRKNGKWKNPDRHNLQAGVTGQWRAPIACFPIDTFDYDTRIRHVKGIELRKVIPPDVWSAREEFVNTVTMFGVHGYQFNYEW